MRAVRIAALFVLWTAVAGCTETPSDLPPCVDPNGPPCPPYDAGTDATKNADAPTPVDVTPGP